MPRPLTARSRSTFFPPGHQRTVPQDSLDEWAIHCEALGGHVLALGSSNSRQRINPLDLHPRARGTTDEAMTLLANALLLGEGRN